MERRGRFSIGAVLHRTFAIYLGNFIPFSVLSALVYAPLALYTWGQLEQVDALSFEEWINFGLVFFYGAFLLRFVLTGLLAYGTFRQLQGERAGFGACVVVGLRRLGPVVGVIVMAGLAVLLSVLPVGLGMAMTQDAGPVGLMLLIPAVLFFGSVFCRLWVAVPVAVVEKPGVFASLTRSALLTKGKRWQIFGALLLLFLFEFVLIRLLEMAAGIDTYATHVWLRLALSAEMAILWGASASVIYYELRTTQEGAGIEELTRVFE